MPKRSTSARRPAAGALPHVPASAKPAAPATAAAAMDLEAFMAGGFDDVMAAAERGGGEGGKGERRPAGAAHPTSKPVPAAKKQHGLSAADRHKAELAALKEKDPEFFNYLEAADEELLAFEGEEEEEEEEEASDLEGSDGEEEDDNSSSSSSSDDDAGEVEDAPAPVREVISPATSNDEYDEDEEGEEGEEVEGGARQPPTAAAPATPDRPGTRLPPPPPRPQQAAQILEWCRSTKADPSLRSLRTLMQTFRAACHHGEVGPAEDDGGAGAQAALRLGSGAAFNTLLLFVLREADGLFRRVLELPAAGPDEVLAVAKSAAGQAGAPPKARPAPLDPRTSPRWRKAEPLIKSYLGNALHLLGTMTDPAMSAFILRCARPSVPFLVCSDRLQRKWLKAALAVFGGPDPGPALQAALFVRASALALPDPTPDAALKGMYREYVRSSKFMSASHAARLALDAACVVETYGAVGGGAAYRHAFAYVRQLAQVVRGAMGSKTKDAFRAVYCWQTVGCLELWARAVGELAGEEATASLGALAFPVSHLLQAAASLVPTPRYFPLRLRCLRALVGLAAAVGVYAPVAPLLCDMLEWKGLHSTAPNKKRGRGGGSGGVSSHTADPDAVLLRASKASLASPAFQADLVDQVVELLADSLAPWSTSPSFPELARPTCVRLRAFAKKCPVDKLRSPVRGLIACLDANTAYVVAARAKAGIAPADTPGVAAFLADARAAGTSPLVRYATILAQRARDRRTMQTAGEFKVGGRARRQEEDESESEEEEEEEKTRPAAKKRGAAAKPAAASKAAPPAEPTDWADDDEDLLHDYNPSDSDGV